MNQEDCKELEGATRLSVEGNVVHHGDLISDGSYLTLSGVKWAVRPLVSASGARVVPEFTNGECRNVRMQGAVQTGGDQLTELAGRISATMPVEEEVCETCGQAKSAELVVDLEEHEGFLRNMANYAAALLRQQYDLSDEQLGQLLTYGDSALPRWIIEVAGHVHGLPAVIKPIAILGGRRF